MVRDISRFHRSHARPANARLRKVILAGLGAFPLILAAPAHADVLDRVAAFKIQPEMLRRALLDFAQQAHVQVLFRGLPQGHIRTTALRGRYTGRQAMERLLSGTGLTYTVTDDAVEIFPKHYTMAKAQAPGSDPSAHRSRRRTEEHARVRSKGASIAPPILQQVIVTGTHISGGPPPSEPIISITRRQIRESGYQSVEQLMDALPENFNSVGSEQNNFQSETDAGNVGYGAAVDLMGLGSGSSLVLVNGHRLAPAGINGAFTDISVIPLSAVKRIDIVTDGASAIYGADAIGGVVNYVLRNRQHGGETSVEYGSVTGGSLKDYRVSQSYGLNWASGHALLSYEYHDATPLDVLDRSFSAPAAPGDLTPGLTQNSAYITAVESPASDWTITGDAFFSHRRNTETVAAGTQALSGYADTTQYSYALGTSVTLPRAWSFRARISYGKNHTSETSIYGSLSGDNKLVGASLVANGDIYQLPAGRLKAAVGLQVRYEALSSLFTGLYNLGNVDRHRTVDSAFIESEIPLVQSGKSGNRRPALTMDLAARVDHYSDFGTSVNPRAGLAWRVAQGLKIRGTVSSSFKAPNFFQLYGAQYTQLLNSPEPQLAPGETVAYLYLFGSNPALTAERSTEWTAGLDWEPHGIRGLSATVTYYDVRFKRRIVDLGLPPLAALDQGEQYNAYIERNPSAAQLESLATPEYSYQNLTTFPGLGPARSLLDAVAIVDDRFQNLGKTRTSGVLATASYQRRYRRYEYQLGFNGAYILRFDNTSTPESVAYSTLNTLDNPVDFRGRLSAGIHHAAWGLHAFLNYVNHYRDMTTGVPVPVASWTTLDITGSYRLFAGSPRWGKTRIYISCVNCLNRNPPAVRLISDYLGYDPANANAMGRFLSASVSVRW